MIDSTWHSSDNPSMETERADCKSISQNNQPATSELTDLECAIVSTVSYRDQFDWPMTSKEIWHFLHGHKASLTEVEDALRGIKLKNIHLETDGHYYALNGRLSIISIRYERELKARKLWPKAKILASILASMPFVRMVGVTGSLAANNPYEPLDIDFMVIIEGGKLWRVRALSKLLQVIDRRFIWRVLCVNYFITTKALSLNDKRLYVAQELFQMVPLFGKEAYHSLIQANEWAKDFLPNAAERYHRHDISIKPSFPVLKKILQFVSAWPFGDMLEHWEGTRKMQRYNKTDHLKGKWSEFTWDTCGHRLHIGDKIEENWRQRMALLDPADRGPQ